MKPCDDDDDDDDGDDDDDVGVAGSEDGVTSQPRFCPTARMRSHAGSADGCGGEI